MEIDQRFFEMPLIEIEYITLLQKTLFIEVNMYYDIYTQIIFFLYENSLGENMDLLDYNY